MTVHFSGKSFFHTLLLIAGTFYLFACNNSTPQKQAGDSAIVNVDSLAHIQDSLRTDSIGAIMAAGLDRAMSNIDTTLDSLEKITGFLQEGEADTLKLELYLRNKKPAKLIYTTFDDGGTAAGVAAFFFDTTGAVLGHKNYFEEEKMEAVSCYLGNDTLLVYRKSGGRITMAQPNRVAQQSIKARDVRSLDDYMMALHVSDYTTPALTTEAGPSLLATGAVTIYQGRNLKSPVLKTMPERAHLIYLGNDRDSIAGNRNLKKDKSKALKNEWWYHVATEDSVNGWIQVHPGLMSELNDENY